MAHIEIDESLFDSLKDKVVVLTGGATGIGRAAVRLFNQYGAKVIFGDVSDQLGHELEKEINSPNVKYAHCDVTSYASQLSLFKIAKSLFSRIDIVVANAGISNPRDPFSSDADINVAFSTTEIDVNLKGCLYTARIGNHFLRENGDGDLVLLSSIAGFKESTGLPAYTASKHGVVGILRGQSVQSAREGVRMNVVCPWMTKTGMVAGIEAGWRELGLPENVPEDVARSILVCATANCGKGKTHQGARLPFAGKILFVAGGQSYEIEDNIQELEPAWLGKSNSEKLRLGQDFLMNGETSWDTAISKL